MLGSILANRAHGWYECYDCNVTPSITPVVTPTDTPEITPTETPEATPSEQPVTEAPKSDNRVDQFSCTINDCNTKKGDKPSVVLPKAPPNTGYAPCGTPRTCGWK